MGILSRSADLVYTFRFLKLLVTPWEEMDAFENGVIDGEGTRTNKPLTSKDKASYNTFHRLVFNIKRIIEKVPGLGKKLGSYISALFLLKEELGMTDKGIQKILKEMDISLESLLSEESSWFISDDGKINQGVYHIEEQKVVNSTFEPIVNRFDKVRVSEDCYPIGDVLGIAIYEVTHLKTNQKIYVSSGELKK